MTEKLSNKLLHNLEKQFANNNPVLQKAIKVFQELDQIEYDLGLIDMEESTASKQSWWPVISLFGGNSSAKARFINSYLGSEKLLSGIQSSSHKFSVLLHSNQVNPVTLPATALDVDPRYPFYQVSRKIELEEVGEGNRINSYLELKAYNSEQMKGKLYIDAPNMMTVLMTPVITLLVKHTIEQSDLVLVFTDALEQDTPLINEFVKTIIKYQDSNKFIYLIEESATLGNADNISLWQRRLAEFGLNTGQFIIMPNQQTVISPQTNRYFAELDQRIDNVGHDRSYRVLEALEKNIHDVETFIIPEVKKGLELWKDRANLSSLLVLSFIAALVLVAEVQIGVLDMLIDPIIGPISLAVLILMLIPAHLMASKLLAGPIVDKLMERQEELCLLENLAGVFEKHLTFWRMLLPITRPAGWDNKAKVRLAHLSDKTKALVQELNDYFSGYTPPPVPAAQDSERQSFADLPE